MELDWFLYLLAALGGAFAGFVATLAGLGSVLTLYILMDVLQLDPDVANGTNRLGIMAMCLMALPSFYRTGHVNIGRDWRIIIALFFGAIGGFILALNIDNTAFREVFKYLLIVMLGLVLLNPKQWMRTTDAAHQLNWWVAIPVFITMGFYAGFIQLGTGVFLVVFLAMYGKFSLVDANGIKLAAFGLYTMLGIVLFALNDKIDWGVGFALASGQGMASYFTAKFATSYPNANRVVRYVLIFVLIVAIVKMFKIYEWVL